MKTKSNRILKIHNFDLSPKEHGSEGLTLTTKFISNGDEITEKKGIYINQVLTLQSYANSASLNLYGINLTPEIFRQLANELESARNSLTK